MSTFKLSVVRLRGLAAQPVGRRVLLCFHCLQRRSAVRRLPLLHAVRWNTSTAANTESGLETQTENGSSMESGHKQGGGGEGQIEPPPEEIQDAEPWLKEELQAYYFGRHQLARMMGKEPSSFSNREVKEALQYLLPSRLTAKDARPFLKHPSEVFQKRIESAFNAGGRPLEAAFYTCSPAYHNLVYEIYQKTRAMEEEGQTTPKVGVASNEENERGSKESVHHLWVKKEILVNILAEELSDKQYEKLISRLRKLAGHPLSEQPEVRSFLDRFRRPLSLYRPHPKVLEDGGKGEGRGVGRRKTSVAQVTLHKGTGVFTINGHSLLEYLPRVEDRQQVLFPFLLVGELGKYDVEVRVHGGGTTGQTGAIRLGVSRALVAVPGDQGEKLERAGLLVRDPRMVERKKPGQKKARKKFTWKKR